jgi:hypothetical protein
LIINEIQMIIFLLQNHDQVVFVINDFLLNVIKNFDHVYLLLLYLMMVIVYFQEYLDLVYQIIDQLIQNIIVLLMRDVHLLFVNQD